MGRERGKLRPDKNTNTHFDHCLARGRAHRSRLKHIGNIFGIKKKEKNEFLQILTTAVNFVDAIFVINVWQFFRKRRTREREHNGDKKFQKILR